MTTTEAAAAVVDKDADEAPVTADDVVKARATFAAVRAVVVVGAAVVAVAAGLAVYEGVERADEDRAVAERKAWLMQRAVALSNAPPDIPIHRGRGVVVVEDGEFVALVEGGAVKASGLKKP